MRHEYVMVLVRVGDRKFKKFSQDAVPIKDAATVAVEKFGEALTEIDTYCASQALEEYSYEIEEEGEEGGGG